MRRVSGVLLVAGIALAMPANSKPKPATPAQQPVSEEAAKLKVKGDQAMLDLSYEEALAAYEAAQRIDPSPTLDYNIGRALQALGRYPEALDHLEAFARDASPELKARVPALEELRRELASKVSTLAIRCNVNGARVFVGGKDVGRTPLDPLRLNAGATTLEVSIKDRLPFKKKIVLRGNSTLDIDVQLRAMPKSGTLLIRSDVGGAIVSLDGKRLGAVPAEAVLAPGSHRVRLERDGYEPLETSAVVRAGARREIELSLEKTPGITSRWWFWTAVGGTVLAGTALTMALLTEGSADSGNIEPGQVKAPLFRFGQ